MNILFLTDGITPYVTGGMQQFANVLVKLLLNQNISITLVHCGQKGEHIFKDDINSVFTANELANLEIVFIPLLNKGKWPGHYIYENKVYSKRIFKQFQNRLNEFDFIYAQGFTGWAFGNKQMKAKLLVNFHGFEMFQKAPNLRVKLEHYLLRPFVKQNCKQADFVYSFGGKISDIIKQLGVSESKILNQSNGIEGKWIGKTSATNNPLRFIFIGRNERRKGIEELTAALLQLTTNNAIDFEFTFIGPIEPNPALKNSVNYVGEIKDQNKIHEYLRTADVLVCPSHAEGMPTVILEAMANGLAIIATDVGATSKMIDGNGIILKNISPESIIEAVLTIVNAPTDDIEIMKKQSIKLVKSQFIWEDIAKNIVRELQQSLT